MSDEPEITWDGDTQSADELATALFERMVADGMPVSMAAKASEDIKRHMVSFVEREQLRIICEFLRFRLRRMTNWVWLLCGITIGQALGIMFLNEFRTLTLIAEGTVLLMVAYVLLLILRDHVALRQTNSDSNGGK